MILTLQVLVDPQARTIASLAVSAGMNISCPLWCILFTHSSPIALNKMGTPLQAHRQSLECMPSYRWASPQKQSSALPTCLWWPSCTSASLAWHPKQLVPWELDTAEAPAPRITPAAPDSGSTQLPPAGQPASGSSTSPCDPCSLPPPFSPRCWSTACTTQSNFQPFAEAQGWPYFPWTASSPASTRTTRQLIPCHSSTFLVSVWARSWTIYLTCSRIFNFVYVSVFP